MSLQQDVQAMVAALEAQADIKPLADQIIAAIAPATSGSLDAGANKRLSIIPGYGPLADPRQYFYVLDEL